MGLHWGSAYLQKLIGDKAWSQIQTVQVDPNVPTAIHDKLTFYHAATGEVLMQSPIDNFYRLRRSALRSFLIEGLDVRFGKTLHNIEYSEDGKSVTAACSDGTFYTASLLVGADGTKSVVRQTLLERKTLHTRIPVSATFIQAKYTKEQAHFLRSFHPLYLAGIHPDNKFCFFGMQYAPEIDDPSSWTFFFYISYISSIEEQAGHDNDSNGDHLARAKGFAKSFTDPWKSAYAWLQDDHPVWHMNFSEWDPSVPEHRWDNHGGRVTVCGDAGHVMTYQRGQGLNHSLQDASKLCDAIISSKDSPGKNIAELVSEYEREMIERTGNEVRLCTINTKMLHDWEKMLQSPVMQKGMKKG